MKELADARRIRNAESSDTKPESPAGKDLLTRAEADPSMGERGTGKVLYARLPEGNVENKINFYNRNVFQQNLASSDKTEGEDAIGPGTTTTPQQSADVYLAKSSPEPRIKTGPSHRSVSSWKPTLLGLVKSRVVDQHMM